jgi:TfoX/Sxy family transcriptional regulator of competence genes
LRKSAAEVLLVVQAIRMRADQHLDISVLIGHSRRMATDKKTVAFIVDQLSPAGDVSAKPMFGEHGLYCNGTMFGMICDGQLFIKPTAGGRRIGSHLEEAPPYPGAKACLLVDPDRWDDSDWLAELVQLTVADLPIPRTKARNRKPTWEHDDPAATAKRTRLSVKLDQPFAVAASRDHPVAVGSQGGPERSIAR